MRLTFERSIFSDLSLDQAAFRTFKVRNNSFVYIVPMNAKLPKVLILGHSFVKRLKLDLDAGFDERAQRNFKLSNSVTVDLHGVGGRTVSAVKRNDLHLLASICPDILILEIGTNDLSGAKPEVIGSSIHELVLRIRAEFHVRVVGVCQVIPRRHRRTGDPDVEFNDRATLLNHYVSVVLEEFRGHLLGNIVKSRPFLVRVC